VSGENALVHVLEADADHTPIFDSGDDFYVHSYAVPRPSEL
jgi:hypothetical protein